MHSEPVEDLEEESEDDPLLDSLSDDLDSDDKKNDNLLLFVLLPIALVAILYDRSSFKNQVIDIVGIFIGVAIVVYFIYRAIKKKQATAMRYKLSCPTCGFTPMTKSSIMSTAITKHCKKCGAILNG